MKVVDKDIMNGVLVVDFEDYDVQGWFEEVTAPSADVAFGAPRMYRRDLVIDGTLYIGLFPVIRRGTSTVWECSVRYTDPRYTNVKFVVCADDVKSKHDGQWHFVSAQQIARLHNLRPSQWLTLQQAQKIGLSLEGLTILRPRFDGDYKDYSGA